MENVLAFASGIALTVVVHFFTVRRTKLEMWDQEYALFDAAKEELRYALRELEFLKRGLTVKPGSIVFRGYEGQPPFKSALVRKMEPHAPISPRVIVTLNALFDDVEAIGARIRSGVITPEDLGFLERTIEHALRVFAGYNKTTRSIDVPLSTTITGEDIASAKKLIGFLSPSNAFGA